MGLAVLMAILNDGCSLTPTKSTPLSSLCVLDAKGTCWIHEAGNLSRVPQAGDYVLSPVDMNRIIEKLKSVQ